MKRVQIEPVVVDNRTYYKLHEDPFHEYITEPEKQVPVAYDVDVAVVGSGISGLFAAIAAGRMGASTLLIERLGRVGGNIGPGMIIAGGIDSSIAPGTTAAWSDPDASEKQTDAHTDSIPGGPVGLVKEFLSKVYAMRLNPENFSEESHIVSYLGFKMLQEAGVEVLLSVYASDPITTDGRVTGLFVEGKSGRVAVRAKVVIDATGDASLAERAGAPMIKHVPPKEEYGRLISPSRLLKEFAWWNETALAYLVGGVEESEEEHALSTKPAVGVTFNKIGFKGQFETNSMAQISEVERHLHIELFEQVEALRRTKPGYEKAYLMATSSFIGARGGPCIEGEHVLTIDEAWRGQMFDDVICRHTLANRAYDRTTGKVFPYAVGYNKRGFEHPYRMFLPRTLDCLLVTGRGASYIRRGHDAGGTRHRVCMMTLGDVCGRAAAMAVKRDCTPKSLDIKALQQTLLAEGYNLGEPERLQELGLQAE